VEEAYLSIGISPVVAKAAAVIAQPSRQSEMADDLLRKLKDLDQGYLNSDDLTSSGAIRQMGKKFAQQLSESSKCLLHDLATINFEKEFLDPTTDSARLQELDERKAALLANHEEVKSC
jgi:hypothetical protein